MLSWGRKYLTPPAFEDEEKNQLAQMLYPTLLFIAAARTVILVPFLLIGSERMLRSANYAGLSVISVPLFLALLHRGYVRSVGYGIALLIWGLITAIVLGVGGIRSPALGFLVFAVTVILCWGLPA